MSVAMPKRQAKEPIDLDIIVVCRKSAEASSCRWTGALWDGVLPAATEHVSRFRQAGRQLGRNDVRIILMAHLIQRLSTFRTVENALKALETAGKEIETRIDRLHLDAPSAQENEN